MDLEETTLELTNTEAKCLKYLLYWMLDNISIPKEQQRLTKQILEKLEEAK